MVATYYLFDDIGRSRALQAEKNLAEDDAIDGGPPAEGMIYADYSVLQTTAPKGLAEGSMRD
jgi:hypothetical protein